MESIETLKVLITEEHQGQRIDKVMTNFTQGQESRSRVQVLIDDGFLSPKRTCSYKVIAGEEYELIIPLAVDAEPIAQDIAINVVYEDSDLLVINKATGMVVHPAAGHPDGTLVNALLSYCGDDLSGIGGVKRPGIVHRLDKETTGLMVVAKNDAAHRGLSEQLASRTLKRIYKAVVWGVPLNEGTIEANIGRSKTNRKKQAIWNFGAREAVTHYKRLDNFGIIASLVECKLQTGRTHQIRVHMAHMNHWLVGDPLYGKSAIDKFLRLNKVEKEAAEALKGFPRQALHAAGLEFIHPISEDKISLKADLPDDMQNLLNTLENIRS